MNYTVAAALLLTVFILPLMRYALQRRLPTGKEMKTHIAVSALIAFYFFAGAVLATAKMYLHDSAGCALYAVTVDGNLLHVGCKGDPTMPKAAGK